MSIKNYILNTFLSNKKFFKYQLVIIKTMIYYILIENNKLKKKSIFTITKIK